MGDPADFLHMAGDSKLLLKVHRFIGRLPSWLIVCVSFALVLAVGAAYHFTGSRLAVSLFYLFPISLVTLYVQRWYGYLLSCFCFDIWILSDVIGHGGEKGTAVPILNGLFELTVFFIFVTVLGQLRKFVASEKERARIDPLTKLSNRFGFYERSEAELARARRNRDAVTIAIIDVDNFKDVNDRFGHITGDMLLETMAETMRNSLRAFDLTARFGGDEFVVLFSVSDVNHAGRILERLYSDLNLDMQINNWPVSFSIGAITSESLPESVDEMICRADELMYSVKRSGRNRIAHEVVPSIFGGCKQTGINRLHSVASSSRIRT